MQFKQQVAVWLNRAAQFWFMLTVLVYLWACVVAGKPIGPNDYVRFGYHVIQWQPGKAGLPHEQSAYMRER